MTRFDADWQEKYSSMVVGPDEAIKSLNPGQRVFIGTGCAEPLELVRALTRWAAELPDTEIVHLLTFGEAPYAHRELSHLFRINSFFIAENVRDDHPGRASATTPRSSSPTSPASSSSGQSAAGRGADPGDAAGREAAWCSLGVSVDIVKSAAENASLVIAQVNPNDAPHLSATPRSTSTTSTCWCPSDEPILETAVRSR